MCSFHLRVTHICWGKDYGPSKCAKILPVKALVKRYISQRSDPYLSKSVDFSVFGLVCFRYSPKKSENPLYNAMTPTQRFSILIQIFAPQKKQEMWLVNIYEKPPPFSSQCTLGPIWGIWSVRGGKKKCFCCIFDRAAQFNPTLTFKAQGLIPSLVKAFVWGSPSRLAPASLSLQCPPKAYWQIFTQDSSLKKKKKQPSLTHPFF